jgi:3'-5' exonuclease
MKRTIFIDIETLPALNLPASGSPAVKPASSDENHLKTALNGDFGRLLCIGFIDESPRGEIERGVIGWDARRGVFHGDERITLTEFWLRLKTFRPNIDRIVGHNIYDFDLKFILKRSVVHGVRPTVDLSFARYRNQPIFDTMYEWERWSYGSKASLETLARALGFESSKQNGVNGSQIHSLFEAGEHRVIHDYCLKDVELTRAIYKRMVFEEYAPAAGPRPIVTNSGLALAR